MVRKIETLASASAMLASTSGREVITVDCKSDLCCKSNLSIWLSQKFLFVSLAGVICSLTNDVRLVSGTLGI